MVSAKCSRCSPVSRGRIVDRPKPSRMPGMRVSGELELLCDHCRSRETWARRWLTILHETALVSDAVAVSVAACSIPLSEMPYVVEENIVFSRVTRRVHPYREQVVGGNVHVNLGKSSIAQ